MKKRKPARSKTEREHDNLFRGAFSINMLATAHLQEVLPSEILKELDLETMQLSSESYVDGDLKAGFSDVVWQCSTVKNGNVKITFLFEHKSDLPDKPIDVQLLQYVLGIWQKELADGLGMSFVKFITGSGIGRQNRYGNTLKVYLNRFDGTCPILNTCSPI